MTRSTPSLRNFAARLIAHEAQLNKTARIKCTAVFPVSEKLRPHLSTFMGKAGFRALLARALALAAAEVPWLGRLQVRPDGSLQPAAELMGQIPPAENAAGREVLLAQLLGLMVTFIGEKLTLRLVHEVWPTLTERELHFGKGTKK
jgi:hypothetical protein